MKKKLIIIGIIIILVFVAFSGCNTKNNDYVSIQGVLLTGCSGEPPCYFVVVMGFNYDRYYKMWINKSKQAIEMEEYLNSFYYITEGGSLIYDHSTGDQHEAKLKGVYSMHDDIEVTGIPGTILDPLEAGKISKSIDLKSIKLLKDNSPD